MTEKEELDAKIEEAQRDEQGRLLPGFTTKRMKTPSKRQELKAFVNMHSMEAAERLLMLMRTTRSEKVQLECIKQILDRSLGKPQAHVEVSTTESLTELIRPIIIQNQAIDVTPENGEEDDKKNT